MNGQKLKATLRQQRFDATLRIGVAVPGPAGLPNVIQDEGVDLPVRAAMNFTGTGVTVTDDAAGERTIVTIPGGGQTPWSQSIDAANNDLNNLGVLRLTQVTLGELDPQSGLVGFANEAGTLHMKTGNGGSIDLESIGNGRVLISTDGARRFVMHQNGNVGIGSNMNPSYKLDVDGEVRSQSGGFRFPDGTVQVTSAAQTPWVQHVDAANHRLDHALGIALGDDNGWFVYRNLSDPNLYIRDMVNGRNRIVLLQGTPGQAIFDGAINAGGVIESTSGGFRFPDGSVQVTSAAQTPWAQHIDAAGFYLNNVSNVYAQASCRADTIEGRQTIIAGDLLYITNTAGDASVLFRLDAYANDLGILAVPSATTSASISFHTGAAGGSTTKQLSITPAGIVSAEAQIESKSGGFKFPDATVQTTAYVGTAVTEILNELTPEELRALVAFVRAGFKVAS